MSPTYEFSQFTAAEKTKLAGVEEGATADQTGAEMVAALEGLSGDARLSADGIKDGATQAIPTVAQKAKIDDAVISSPGAGEEKITQIDIITDGGKLKVTTPEA